MTLGLDPPEPNRFLPASNVAMPTRILFVFLVLAAGAACGHGERAQTVAPMIAPATATDRAPDPTTTDPDKYVVVLENAQVRVLRYHDEPGARTRQHHHPDSVLYALSSFRRRLTFPDGTTREREFKAGDVMWVPAQTHMGENIGTTPTEVLLVEPRSARSAE
jgi:quercetin dioxygenase-like cupin family protein